MLIGKKPIGTIAYLGGLMSLPEPFCWSWSQMIQFNSDYLVDSNQSIFYNRATVSYHVYARNSLVDQMKGDWLLMLDTDIKFEPDIAMRMLNIMDQHKIDVLAAIYTYKAYPHSPVLFLFNDKGDALMPLGDWSDNAQIYELGSAGAGCLMVRKSVFDKIKKAKESPFDIIHPFSEDHSFFRRLKKLKIKAYYSPLIEVNHLGYKQYSLKDYDKSVVRLSKKTKSEGRILR